MTFSVTGAVCVQTGTDSRSPNDNTVLNDITASFLGVTQSAFYEMNDPKIIEIQGAFLDVTGRFNLLMKENTRLQARSGGSFTVGKVTGSGGNSIYEGGGTLTIIPTTQGGYGQTFLSYDEIDAKATDQILQFYGSVLNLYSKNIAAGSPVDYFITGASGCRINGIDQTGTGEAFSRLRLAPGSHFSDNICIGIQGIEFHGASSFERNSFTNLADSFIVFDAGIILAVENADFKGVLDSWGWISNGGVNYINIKRDGVIATEAQIEATQAIVDVRGFGGSELPTADRRFKFSKTQSEILVDEAGAPISTGITVRYKNNDATVFTPTITGGVYKQQLLLKESTNESAGMELITLAFNNFYPIEKAVYGYTYELQTATYSDYDSFLSIGADSASEKLIKNDSSITQSAKEAVDAYTSIDDAFELYDRAKSYLVDNYAGETAIIVSRTGDTIDAGTYDVTIDATAVTAFTFDGSVITIKATTFTGNITTTGTVTLANGASMVGGIIDSNGDSFFNYTEIDNWEVYATESDRDNSTNLLESGTVNDNYRFIFSGGTTYYFWLIKDGEEIKKFVTPSQSGETIVTLATAGAIAAISGQISALNNFNPAVDVVANVTLVDTTTTNTDMRGTDGANVGEVNANIVKVNNVTVDGDGTTGNEWGPI